MLIIIVIGIAVLICVTSLWLTHRSNEKWLRDLRHQENARSVMRDRF